jgi:hypothetical protein
MPRTGIAWIGNNVIGSSSDCVHVRPRHLTIPPIHTPATMETISKIASTVTGGTVGVTKPAEPDDWLKASEVEVVQPDEEAKAWVYLAVVSRVVVVPDELKGRVLIYVTASK